MNQQLIDALQQIHELNQTLPNRQAGAAWANFIENIIGVTQARARAGHPTGDEDQIVATAIARSDLDLDLAELGM